MTEPRHLLDDVADFVRRYVVLTAEQADLCALWVAHTYVVDVAETTPYVHVTGPERRCGKSRLLEVLAALVHKPVEAANISEAALFRVIAKEQPTVLFDEIDAVFGGRSKDHEDLRGLLNAGHRRGAKVWRCVGDGSKQEVHAFPVFGAKCFAGIGDTLPDTLADRSVRIRLKRKTKAERVETFRARDADELAAPLRQRLEWWGDEILEELAAARPDLPAELNDRAQDGWEPLLAIADLAGGDWPERARRAAVTLSGEGELERDSLGVRLLADIRAVFEKAGVEAMFSKDLAAALRALEEAGWDSYLNRGLNETDLARLLRPYEIRPHTRSIRIGDATGKGWKLEWFGDAFSRYLSENGGSNVTPSQPSIHAGSPSTEGGNTFDSVTGRGNGANPHGPSGVTSVTPNPPVSEEGGEGPRSISEALSLLDELGGPA